ncbi:MAG: tetratricopeptide repeat protein [Spirochaetaceae bacterium]
MRRFRRAMAATLAFLTVSAPLSAQMDMLPQFFRDLPPELADGLPTEMEYDEYERMTRNMDFFAMFMAMWVPGYALFSVDEPALGWTVAGVRAGGAAMILTGIGRQWRDLNDFWQLSSIAESPDRYRRAVGNMALISGGFFINGMAWAADVAAAFRIAQNRKSFVQYKYGIRTGLAGDARERDEAYIRRLARQDGREVREDLERSLRRYIDSYPDSSFVAEAEYQLGALLATEERDAEAVLVLLRQLAVHPDPRSSPASRRTLAMLIQRNRHEWETDREPLLELTATGAQAGAEAAQEEQGENGAERPSDESSLGRRYRPYLDTVSELQTEEFRRLYVEEARTFLKQYPDAPFADQVLFTRAAHLEELGDIEEAVITYTQLAASHPDSGLRPRAMLRVGILLEEELDEDSYAERFYRHLVEKAPQSDAAEEARRRLGGTD